jgi:hypothetical protein
MLSQWRQYIEPSEFETLIDFVNKTKEGQKWSDHKYIYIYCKNQSLKVKLISDICKIVGKDDCKYCKPNPYKSILVKNLFEDNDDDDNEDDNDDDNEYDNEDDNEDEDEDEEDEKYNEEYGMFKRCQFVPNCAFLNITFYNKTYVLL